MKNPLFASGFFACRAGKRVDGEACDVRGRKDGMNMIDANGKKTALSALSASATVPMLELTDAVVRRAGKDILAVPSFALAEGESMALLGPNGAGKSTFVKLITREVFPLHRDMPPVVFRGKERCTLQEVKQALGVVSATMQDEITVHVPVIEIVCRRPVRNARRATAVHGDGRGAYAGACGAGIAGGGRAGRTRCYDAFIRGRHAVCSSRGRL